MNIWLLASQYTSLPADGSDQYVSDTSAMLAQAGHRVTVVTPAAVDAESILPGGARLLQFASPSASDVLAPQAALSYELAAYVTEYVKRDGMLPDVIESQEYEALPYYLIQRRLVELDHPLRNVPVLVHSHGPSFSIAKANQEARYRFPGYWIGQMEKFALLAADGQLTPSTFLENELAQAVPQIADRIAVLPYPYMPPPTLDQERVRGDLLYVGALEVRQGVLPLVHTCAELWSQGHNFRLTLLGDDTLFAPRAMTMATFLRKRYAQWVASDKLVILNEELSRSARLERMASAWAVVIPSLWNAFPLSGLEAMSLGKLVVASTTGGQVDMLGNDGHAGILFNWAQPEACATTILQTLEMDETHMQEIGAHARERITQMTSYEHVLPQRIEHYQQVIEQMEPKRRLFPCVTPGITGNTLPLADDAVFGLLSVVIPYYNLGRYVEETVASVLESSYHPLEIVLIDDGTDEPESIEALERIETRYSERVRVVRTPNRGLAAARNIGAASSKGEYLAFVDADDLVERDFFERAVAVLDHYTNVSFAYSWVRYFGNIEGLGVTWNTEFPYLLGHNMFPAFVVLRRSDFLTYGQNRPEMAYALEDHDGWIGMVKNGCIGVSLPDPLVHYRLRSGSMVRSMNDIQALYLFDRIVEHHRELYQRFGPELFGLLNANGSSFLWDSPLRSTLAGAQDIVALRNHAATLLDQHNQLRDSWQMQQAHIVEQQQQYDALQVTWQKQQAYIAEQQQQLETLQASWQAQEAYIAEQHTRITAQQAYIAEQQQQYSVLQEITQEQHVFIAELQQHHDALQKAWQEQRIYITDQQEQLAALQISWQEQQTYITDLQQNHAALQALCQEQQTYITDLQGQLTALQTSWQEQHTYITNLQQQHSALQAWWQAQQMEIAQLQERVNNFEKWFKWVPGRQK